MADQLELAEQFVTRVWQNGDVDYIQQVCAENFTDFTFSETEGSDAERLQDYVAELRDAFPDLQVQVADSFQDADFCILRILFTGTQRAEYDGFAPTDGEFEWESIDILHFDGDQVIERWSQSDLLLALEETDDAKAVVEPDTSFGALQADTEHAELLEQLAETPGQLRNIVRKQGVQSGSRTQWSTGAAIGYLWRAEVEVWQHRLGQLQREENPGLQAWDDSKYEWEAEFGATDILALLDAFEFRRLQTCNYLKALEDGDWARTGRPDDGSELDVAGLMRETIKQDREYLTKLSGAEL